MEHTSLSQPSVTHTRYISYADAHYAGNLVHGAYHLVAFGDAATHLSVMVDGHEGLLAGYTDIEFLSPLRGGDVLEVTATLLQSGRRSRKVGFESRIICRGTTGDGSSELLAEPVVASQAVGTVVVPSPPSQGH